VLSAFGCLVGAAAVVGPVTAKLSAVSQAGDSEQSSQQWAEPSPATGDRSRDRSGRRTARAAGGRQPGLDLRVL